MVGLGGGEGGPVCSGIYYIHGLCLVWGRLGPRMFGLGRDRVDKTCPLFRGSTVHKEEDNLSIVDEMAGPKLSFTQRFHCT